MEFLTTHVLDTAHGGLATGVRIKLYRIDDHRRHFSGTTTNSVRRRDELFCYCICRAS